MIARRRPFPLDRKASARHRVWKIFSFALIVAVASSCEEASAPQDSGVKVIDLTGIGSAPSSTLAAVACGAGGVSVGNPYPCCPNDGNCTWFAWKYAGEKWGQELPRSSWGNAKNWGKASRAAGYPVSSAPAANTIAVNVEGEYGHVAFVKRVDDRFVIVEEMNCCLPDNNRCRKGSLAASVFLAGPREATYPRSYFSEFIYPLGAVVGPTPPTSPPLFAYQLAAAPPSIAVLRGSSGELTLNVSNVSSVGGVVDLAVDHAAPHIQVAFAPSRVTLSPNQTVAARVTINTSTSSPLGVIPVRFVGRAYSNATHIVVSEQVDVVIGTEELAPVIQSVTPSLLAWEQDGQIRITGKNFARNVEVRAVRPDGAAVVLGAPGGQHYRSGEELIVTGFAFQMAGAWSLFVVNPSGQQSNRWTISISLPRPGITSVTPNPVVHISTQPQEIEQTIHGTNFRGPVRVFYRVVAPGGQTYEVAPSKLTLVSTSEIRARVTFGTAAATWAVSVHSSDGQQSNEVSFPFQVQPPPPPTTPPTLRVDGATSSTKQLLQTFVITGSGYTPSRSVSRFVRQPNGTQQQISSVTADAAGNIGWNFTPACTEPLGVHTVWATDDATGRQSNSITQTLTANSACPAPAPVVITGINPAQPTVSAVDQRVSVTGSGFQSGLTVTVNYPGGSSTLQGNQIQNVTSSGFDMIILLNIPGTFTIRVNNGNSQQSTPFSFTVVAPPPPRITSVTPNPVVHTSAQPQEIEQTIQGTGFRGPVRVFYRVVASGGQTYEVALNKLTLVSASEIRARVTFGTTAATWAVSVHNGDGQQSNEVSFPFQVQPPPPPTQPTLSVDGGTASTKQLLQTFVVTGSRYTPNRSVSRFVRQPNGTQQQISSVTADAAGNIGWNFTPSCTEPLGVHTVWAIDDATGQQSNSITQTLTANAACSTAPSVVVTGINPAQPTVSAVDQIVSVTGSGFQSGLTVTVNYPGGTSTLQGGQIQNVTSSGFDMIILLNIPGTFTIRVNNGNSQQSNPFTFTVVAPPAPRITSVTPNPVVHTSTQPQEIEQTIHGTNFRGPVRVFYRVVAPGGQTYEVASSKLTLVSASEIRARVTFGTVAATWAVSVHNSDGQQSNEVSFPFQVQAPPPSAPPTLRVDGGTASTRQLLQTFVVSGAGYTPNSSVSRFVRQPNGTQQQISSVTSDAAGNIGWNFTPACTEPLGTHIVWATDDAAGRQSNSITQTLTANAACAAPAITSISPAQPVRNPADQVVRVTGSGFQPGLTIAVNYPGGSSTLYPPNQVRNVASTSLDMVILLSVPGSWSIRVVNPDGRQSAAFGFTVH